MGEVLELLLVPFLCVSYVFVRGNVIFAVRKKRKTKPQKKKKKKSEEKKEGGGGGETRDKKKYRDKVSEI